MSKGDNEKGVKTIGVIAPRAAVSAELKEDAEKMIEAFVDVNSESRCRAIILADTSITHIVREACERHNIESWMVQPDRDKHIPQTTIINIIDKSDYVYLCFDGDDNSIIFALGECLEREKPFRIVQDSPTSPKHMLVDALMRGMKKQAREQNDLGENAVIRAKQTGRLDSLEFGS